MPPVTFDLKRTEDTRDVVYHAVEALAAGKIVAFPTETVYGIAANGLHSAAVNRLFDYRSQFDPQPLPFAVKSADDALDYAPDMPPLGRRLARRCWPGPLTMVLPGPHADSVIGRLPAGVRQATAATGTIGLRVPFHPLTLQILRLSAGATVVTTAKLANGNHAATGKDVMAACGSLVDLILDDGPCRYSQPSTVVRIEGDNFEIVRPGVLDLQTLKRMSEISVLIVCTGNTCRSPMAEGLLKKRLAETHGCAPEKLAACGLNVISAGVAAMPGAQPSPQAVDTMRNFSVNIDSHSSQPVTERLVQNADLILTMTESHRQAIISQWPTAVNRTFTLSQDPSGISDPIGLSVEYYQRCADQIDRSLTWWLENHPLFKSGKSK